MPRQAIGIDIGGTFTKIAIVTENGMIVHSASLPTAARQDPEKYLHELIRRIGRLVQNYPVQGIGIAAAGFLADDRRSIRYNPNTPALVDIDYVDLLSAFQLPVRLEQDLNVPTLAEYYFGEFRSAPRLMTVSIGTGLGAGFMIGDRLLDFAGGTAGDTGHIILDPNGPTCTAGCHGCAEALIATPNIVRLARTQNAGKHAHISAHQVIVSARKGQPWAEKIIEKVGSWLGQWLASLAPIFLPSHIILCGGVAEAGEALRLRAESRFRELSGPEYTRAVIALSRFGGRAGVIGAAAPFLTDKFLTGEPT
jgi:glucokinase